MLLFYSGDLPCNSDVTSLKFLLLQVAFSIMASTIFQGSTFSDAVSYPLKQLQISHVCLKPEQRLSMEAIYDGHDVFMWLPTGYSKSLCCVSRRHLVLILYKAYKLHYCLDKPLVKRRTQTSTRSLFDLVLPLTSLSNPAPYCNVTVCHYVID